MKIIQIPGGWYSDAKATGRYVSVRTNKEIWTNEGNFPYPPDDGPPLFLVCSQPGVALKFAGKAANDYKTWEWIGGQWYPRQNGYGNFSQMYDCNGNLHIVDDVAVGVNGWRYCICPDTLITGDSTYPVVHGLNEWTDLTDAQDRSLIAGQGNEQGGIQIYIDGQNRWLHKGQDYALRAHRSGFMYAFAFYNVEPDGLTAFIIFASEDELRTLEVVQPLPPKPPDPTPDPPKPPDPEPEPEPPVPTPEPPPVETFPPLKTTARYHLHPNIDSDVPGACKADLQTVDVFGLYVQWINEDARWDKIETLKHIRAQGVNLGIELSCIMEGDPHGENSRSNFPKIAQRVLDKGHRVSWLMMDEPIYKAHVNFPTMKIDEIAFAIAKWVEEAKKQFPGVKIALIEPWPSVDVEEMRQCLLVLDSWGCHLDALHLDIDRRRVHDQYHGMIKQAKVYAKDYNLALGVKFAGYSFLTDSEYRADVQKFAMDVAANEFSAIDHVCVQSWAERAQEPNHGPQDLPENFSQDGLFVTFGYIQEQIFT